MAFSPSELCHERDPTPTFLASIGFLPVRRVQQPAGARLEARTTSTAGGQLAEPAATPVEARLFDV